MNKRGFDVEEAHQRWYRQFVESVSQARSGKSSLLRKLSDATRSELGLPAESEVFVNSENRIVYVVYADGTATGKINTPEGETIVVLRKDGVVLTRSDRGMWLPGNINSEFGRTGTAYF